MNRQPTVEQESEAVIRQRFADEEQKKILTKRILFGGSAVIALILLLPLLMLAVQAGLALAAVLMLVVGGLFAKRQVPLWLFQHENLEREGIQVEQNRALAARKSEAKKNPIEQAENEYFRRSQQYTTFKQAMEVIGGKVGALGNKLERTRRENPQYDLSQEISAHQKMEEFFKNRKVRLQDAFVKLAEFKEKIDEARTKWEFQLEANAAIRAMNVSDQEAQINEILTNVAFDSVHEEFNAVFARLDVDAAEISAAKTLEFGNNVVLDVSAINLSQTQQLPRPQNVGA